MKTIRSTFIAGLFILFCTSSCCTKMEQIQRPTVDKDLTHIVIVWLKPEVTPEMRAKIEAGSRDLHKIPGVHDLIVGNALSSDRPIVDDSFDLALSMRFTSQQTLNAYLIHPDHQAYVASIKPHLAKLLVYDLTPTK